MRDVTIRVSVLATLSGVLPVALVGLAALKSPHAIEDAIGAGILALVVLACVHGGWAVRDGYHRWRGWWGPLAWAGIGCLSAVGLAIVAAVGLGGYDDLPDMLRLYAAVGGITAAWTATWWLIGRAMPEGSFDAPNAPDRSAC